MSRTTARPHRPGRAALRTSRTARLLLAGAVTATTLAGVGAASAEDAANPWALTSAGPAYLSTVSPAKVTLTGKGFTNASVVTFTQCLADPAVAAPATGAAVESKGTKLVVTPPVCVAGSTPRIKVVTDAKPESTRTLYTSKITYVEKPAVVAVSPVAPAVGPWAGGTAASITLQAAPVAKAPVQVRLGSGSTAKSVAAKVSPDDPRTFTFKTPPGTPGHVGASVTVFGIASDEVAGAFEYLSTIKVAPSTWVVSTPKAPVVKVSGSGFGTNPAVVTVSVCGVAVPGTAITAVTDKSISFTPPVLSSSVLPGGVGPCTVRVDVSGRTSLVTAGSTFTYAAY